MTPYPKPSATGGVIVRQVIGLLRKAEIQLPLTSHILIACSGGADSIALAHLCAKYGRRIAPKGALTLLHINHGWRAGESDQDERLVVELADSLGIECKVERLVSPSKWARQDVSWEDEARKARKKIYAKYHAQGFVVLTAHHADDLAETLLWRLFTGKAETHGGGIAVQNQGEIRPFLSIRKATLKKYLKEERQAWREDQTNADPRFLRARMRQELLPVVEKIFPKAVEHLVKLGLQAQLPNSRKTSAQGVPVEVLFDAVGLKQRRAFHEAVERMENSPKTRGELHLPDGWRLVMSRGQEGRERWILEKAR